MAGGKPSAGLFYCAHDPNETKDAKAVQLAYHLKSLCLAAFEVSAKARQIRKFNWSLILH